MARPSARCDPRCASCPADRPLDLRAFISVPALQATRRPSPDRRPRQAAPAVGPHPLSRHSAAGRAQALRTPQMPGSARLGQACAVRPHSAPPMGLARRCVRARGGIPGVGRSISRSLYERKLTRSRPPRRPRRAAGPASSGPPTLVALEREAGAARSSPWGRGSGRTPSRRPRRGGRAGGRGVAVRTMCAAARLPASLSSSLDRDDPARRPLVRLGALADALAGRLGLGRLDRLLPLLRLG